MKNIIITSALLITICLRAIGSPHFYVSYFNHTQNIGVTSTVGIPVISFTANVGDSVTLNVFEFDFVPLQSFVWYFNGNLFDTTTTNSLNVIITQTGTYSTTGTQSPYWFFVTAMSPTGISFLTNPSPVLKLSVINSSVSLDLNLVSKKTVEIDIMNLNGKIFRKNNFGIKAGNFTITENIEELVNGIYFIRIKTGDEVFCERFLKL